MIELTFSRRVITIDTGLKQMKTLMIFRYIEELDCFVVTDEYKRVADYLGLTEWRPAVRIGRRCGCQRWIAGVYWTPSTLS